jgi:hypothetical protein
LFSRAMADWRRKRGDKATRSYRCAHATQHSNLHLFNGLEALRTILSDRTGQKAGKNVGGETAPERLRTSVFASPARIGAAQEGSPDSPF